MPLWGSGSNHVTFTADATNDSSRLTNVVVGTGFTFSDLELGQLVVSTGTTGVPYDSRIRNIGSNYIELSNPYIAGTGTTVSFEALDSYKPEKATVGNKAFEGTDVFATESGWVQRRYKKRIAITGDISSGSTIITNVTVAAGNTADLQLGQLVGGIGIPGDPKDKRGNYIVGLLPAAGTGATTIILSDAANLTATSRSLSAYSYWDEVVVGIRELSSRMAEPEIQSVSFNKNRYSVNETGYVIVSFNEPVNFLGTGSTLVVTNSGSGNTTASYAYGSGTNKIYYSFGAGAAGTLSIAAQTIGGTGATVVGVDKSYSTVTFSGAGATSSKTIGSISASDIAKLKVGQPLTGTGVIAGTTITKIDTSSISISSPLDTNATGSATTFSVSEANARLNIYSSYLIGAGVTSTGITGQVPQYSGTNVSYYSGAATTATVA